MVQALAAEHAGERGESAETMARMQLKQRALSRDAQPQGAVRAERAESGERERESETESETESER